MRLCKDLGGENECILLLRGMWIICEQHQTVVVLKHGHKFFDAPSIYRWNLISFLLNISLPYSSQTECGVGEWGRDMISEAVMRQFSLCIAFCLWWFSHHAVRNLRPHGEDKYRYSGWQPQRRPQLTSSITCHACVSGSLWNDFRSSDWLSPCEDLEWKLLAGFSLINCLVRVVTSFVWQFRTF